MSRPKLATDDVAGYTSSVKQPLKALVKNGRLVFDEPTDLPEGSEVELYLVEKGGVALPQRPETCQRAGLPGGPTEKETTV